MLLSRLQLFPKHGRKLFYLQLVFFSILGVLAEAIIAKFSEVISETNSQEEKDDSYKKLKLEEVKQFLDTSSKPNVNVL
jgi:hypothetical protein